MNKNVNGIHHITALAGDPQANLDFYTIVLGLRLVKKTVNFDDPGTYHFYFGDAAGSPGSLLTFFPLGSGAWSGRAGAGQVTDIAFAVPERSLGYWLERLKRLGIAVHGPSSRPDEDFLGLRDPDGLRLELVASGIRGPVAWGHGPVPEEHSIQGFHSAALCVRDLNKTGQLLTDRLEFRPLDVQGNRHRFSAWGDGPGRLVDILEVPTAARGETGCGTVHHIAWRTPGDPTQLVLLDQLNRDGYFVSPVRDRMYFHSIYFREPGGILFEIATDPPGFTVDESPENLGSGLMLPTELEPQRNRVEKALPGLSLIASAGAGAAR